MAIRDVRWLLLDYVEENVTLAKVVEGRRKLNPRNSINTVYL